MKHLLIALATALLLPHLPAACAEDANLSAAVDALSSPQKAERLEALSQIREMGVRAKSAVPALIRTLGHRDADTRAEAARTLGVLGKHASPAGTALENALSDNDDRVRAYAAFALGRIGEVNDKRLEALFAAIVDPATAVRRSAIAALRSLDFPRERALPLLVRTLETADASLIMPAIETLSEAGAKAVPLLCEALKNEKTDYWACLILAQIGPEARDAVPHLVPLLKRPEPEVRKEAVIALGEIGPAAAPAVPEIVRILNEDELMGVRYAAAYALGRIGQKHQAAQAALERSAETDDGVLRVLAVWALVQLNPASEEIEEQAARIILQGLTSDNPNERRIAARAVAESEPVRDEALPGLIAAIQDADEETIEQLISAIAAMGEEAVPRIVRALKVKELRPYAVQVAIRLGPQAKKAVPALIEVLRNNAEDPLVLREVAFALGAIGPDAAAATDVLVDQLSHDNVEVRVGACYALGRIGPRARSATKTLVQVAKTEEDLPRVAAVWALLRIHPDSEKLARFSVPILVEALSSDRPLVRAEVASALGDIGPVARTALPQLQQALQDPEPIVQEAAAAAIRRIEG